MNSKEKSPHISDEECLECSVIKNGKTNYTYNAMKTEQSRQKTKI